MLIVSIFFVGAGSASALTHTNPLNVTASVVASCRVTGVTDIAFGDYDVTDATAKDAAGNMVFKCTKSTAYKTYVVGTRTMLNGAEVLNFEIYSDAGRTAAYPATSGAGLTGTAASSANITRDIYGRIPAEQDVATGSYARELTATIEY
ncbi:MAG: spore coat U domain-containing protein [Smithellaceae bacterium]|nr:spore coat U domain-containing protein [Smithellaceae bacterium]